MILLKKIAFAMILFLLSCGVRADAAGKVYLDIDSPAFQRFPIAVVDFQKLGGDAVKEDLSVWLSGNVSRYLDMTGYFNLIPPKAFLEDQRLFPFSGGKVTFSDWTTIGAEYLVKGGFNQTGRSFSARFRLYDVVKGDLLVEKQYTGQLDEKKSMMRRMAQEIVLALTGDGSIFDTRIAFVAKRGQSADVYTIRFDGTELTRMTNYGSMTLSPRWSPDGQTIAYTSYKDGNPDLYFRRLKDYNTRKISDFRGLNLLGGWSPDGRKLLLTLSKDGNEEIYQLDLGSGQLKRLTHEFSIDVSPSWSPDGNRVAFVSNRSGSPQIFIMNSDGSQVKRLTFEGNYNTSPAWSPRGNQIAYEGRKNGRFRIFTIGVDGSGPMTLGPEIGNNESPSWSPDGRYLTFSQRGYGPGKIYVMNANGSTIRVLYENSFGCMSPAWSPRLKQ